MHRDELILRRLQAQHLLSPAANPAGDLCGLQAQFLRNAVHALRIRTDRFSLDGLVKTWTLRRTVHLLPESDLPLYLPHCGTAEDVCQSTWYQWSAVRGHANPPERERCLARLTVDAIAAGVNTREALRLHLRSQGMTEQEEVIVFNPWGGLIAELANLGVIAFQVEMNTVFHADETKRYRLLAPFTPLPPAVAQLELLRRYFTHYGPATLRDAAYFLHWTQAKLKALLPQLPVQSEVCDGQTHYFIAGSPVEKDLPPVLLLAGFDPLMLGYRKEDNPFLPGEHLRGIFNLAGIVNPAILLRGRVVGKWKEKAGKVDFTAFETICPKDKFLVEAWAEQLFAPKRMTWS